MTAMPAQRVTPPLSGIAIVFGLVFIGICGLAGSEFGNGVAGVLIGLAVVLLLVVAVKRADRRNARRRRV